MNDSHEFQKVMDECIARADGNPQYDPQLDFSNHPELTKKLQEHWNVLKRAGLLEWIQNTRGAVPIEDLRLASRLPVLNLSDLPDRLSGRYECIAELGRGGMGLVLDGHDHLLERRVAVKTFRLAKNDSSSAEFFLREAHLHAQLEHPNIVPIYDYGVHGDSLAYLVLKYVPGRTLDTACVTSSAALNTREAVEAMIALCRAVGYAHSKGIVHRDLKPSNVMLGEFGEIQLMDWGIAKTSNLEEVSIGDLQGSKWHTNSTGNLVGTPSYMAPEQLVSHDVVVGPLTDVFGLGALFMQLISGSPPYIGTTKEEVVSRAREGDRTRIDGLDLKKQPPRELIAICDKALATDPRGRYSNPEELADDLRAFLDNSRVANAWSDGPMQRIRKGMKRNPQAFLSAMAIFVVVALASVGAIVLQNKNQRKQLAIEQSKARVGGILVDVIRSFTSDRRFSKGGWALTNGQDSLAPGETADQFQPQDLLNRFAHEVTTHLDQPEDSQQRADLESAIGESLESLGRYPQAIQLMAAGADRNRFIHGPDSIEALRTDLTRASALAKSDFKDQAEALFQSCSERLSGHPLATATDKFRAKAALASIKFATGQFEECLTALDELEESFPEWSDVAPELKLQAITTRTAALNQLGRTEETLDILGRQRKTAIDSLGKHSPTALHLTHTLASSLINARMIEEAAPLAKQAYEGRVLILGEDAIQTMNSAVNWSLVLANSGQPSIAGEILASLREQLRDSKGAKQVIEASVLNKLYRAKTTAGNIEDAQAVSIEAAKVASMLSPGRLERIEALNNVSETYLQTKQYDLAESTLLDLIDEMDAAFGHLHPYSKGPRVRILELSEVHSVDKETAREIANEITSVAPKDSELWNFANSILERDTEHR